MLNNQFANFLVILSEAKNLNLRKFGGQGCPSYETNIFYKRNKIKNLLYLNKSNYGRIVRISIM